MRIVGFDPPKLRRKRQSIGTCVETGAEAQHGIDSRSQSGRDVVVDDPRTQCHRPRDDAGGGHGIGNASSSLAGEPRRERIAKQRVGAPCFQGAVVRNPEGGVRDVVDGGIHGGAIALESSASLRSSTQVGAWSLGFSQPRISRSTPAAWRRAAAAAFSKR